MNTRKKAFGTLGSGVGASLYTIHAGNITAALTDFGASLVSLIIPDREGNPTDVVLGYDSAAEYEAGSWFFGGTIGRVGNRIGGASFRLNGITYQMDPNNNGNCLHGGFDGYHMRMWDVSEIADSSITFLLNSPDGDQGMPGHEKLLVTYTAAEEADGTHSLQIRYRGMTDADTLLNPTNHSYFNLNGQGIGDILGHMLQIHADYYTEVQDDARIPVANARVNGTPFDFRKPKAIGKDIDTPDCRQLAFGSGYDHNFPVQLDKSDELIPFAAASGDLSGITMEVLSDLPAIQFYSGNRIAPQTGKGGAAYEKHSGFCLETQYIPDSIHHSEFESCIQKAGEVFDSTTIYRFGICE